MRAATPLKKFGSSPGEVKTKDFQFGGALGGPIIQDVMHFFVTYEGKRQEIPREITPGLSLPVSSFPSDYQSAFGSTNSNFNEDLFLDRKNVVWGKSGSVRVDFGGRSIDKTK